MKRRHFTTGPQSGSRLSLKPEPGGEGRGPSRPDLRRSEDAQGTLSPWSSGWGSITDNAAAFFKPPRTWDQRPGPGSPPLPSPSPVPGATAGAETPRASPAPTRASPGPSAPQTHWARAHGSAGRSACGELPPRPLLSTHSCRALSHVVQRPGPVQPAQPQPPRALRTPGSPSRLSHPAPLCHRLASPRPLGSHHTPSPGQTHSGSGQGGPHPSPGGSSPRTQPLPLDVPASSRWAGQASLSCLCGRIRNVQL